MEVRALSCDKGERRRRGRVSEAVGFGARPGEQSLEPPDADGRRGYFTEALLRGLQGEAALPGGEINCTNLATFIGLRVRHAPRGGRRQISSPAPSVPSSSGSALAAAPDSVQGVAALRWLRRPRTIDRRRPAPDRRAAAYRLRRRVGSPFAHRNVSGGVRAGGDGFRARRVVQGGGRRLPCRILAASTRRPSTSFRPAGRCAFPYWTTVSNSSVRRRSASSSSRTPPPAFSSCSTTPA